MKTETINTYAVEPIVIADECGDTLWDEVLQQNSNVCEVNTDTTNKNSLQQSEVSDQDAHILQK